MSEKNHNKILVIFRNLANPPADPPGVADLNSILQIR